MISLKPLIDGIGGRPDLFALYETTLRRYIDPAFGWDVEFQKQLFTRSYADKDGYSIELDDAQVGCLVLNNLESGVHLSLLLIRAEYQRQGVGRRVIEELVGQTRAAGQPVSLSCFLGNQGTIRFYERLGFQVVSTDEHFATLRYPAG